MSRNLTQQLLAAHLADGEAVAGRQIAVAVDQVLIQDNTGTQVYLQFEAMGLPRVRAPLVVTYIDHNIYQFSARNSEDHRFIESAARRFGSHLSRAGAGICHEVHRERFARPGQTLLGSDSHTTTAGGLGMLSFGAGGLDVAVAMGGGPYRLTMPRVVRVELTGSLHPWVGAKDVSLELLRRLTVAGGADRIFEFGGPGLAGLTVPDRCTLANMGAEMGATTCVFPSDEQTRAYLASFGRAADWRPLAAEDGCGYDERLDLDLGAVEPLVALPSMPDRVVPVSEAAGTPVHQVIVGSCTNGSSAELRAVAEILRGRRVHPQVQMVVAPASRSALQQLVREGLVEALMDAGVNLSESTCGACIGFGHVPAAGTVSLRTFNRNFRGRSGLADDRVYLVGPETAAVAAVLGRIGDPRAFGDAPSRRAPERHVLAASDIVPPDETGETELVRGENIRATPPSGPAPERLEATVLIKLGAGVTTDDIIPARADINVFRSNIPRMADFTLCLADPGFAARARERGGGVIVAAENYGQGSSREHAAMCPRQLGVQAVVARSFSRIHRSNLLNQGVAPLLFVDPADYDRVAADDVLIVDDFRAGLAADRPFPVHDATQGRTFLVRPAGLSPLEARYLLAGGLLAYTREHPAAG